MAWPVTLHIAVNDRDLHERPFTGVAVLCGRRIYGPARLALRGMHDGPHVCKSCARAADVAKT